jgi:hypothetical protein
MLGILARLIRWLWSIRMQCEPRYDLRFPGVAPAADLVVCNREAEFLTPAPERHPRDAAKEGTDVWIREKGVLLIAL